jgi:hypothetical protein
MPSIDKNQEKKVRSAMYRKKKLDAANDKKRLTLELTKEQLEFLRMGFRLGRRFSPRIPN